MALSVGLAVATANPGLAAVVLVEDGKARAAIVVPDKPVAVDVTRLLREGENVLAVQVDNVKLAGGTWKPVWLVAGDGESR